MDARLNHGGAPKFPATESDLDPEMVAIAGAIIRQRTGKFEYPLFEVYLSANHRRTNTQARFSQRKLPP